MLHLSSQPNPVLPQNKHDTTNHNFLRIIEQNFAYGCHTELARFNVQRNLSITDTVGDQNFVRYSEVFLTEGLPVYFR